LSSSSGGGIYNAGSATSLYNTIVTQNFQNFYSDVYCYSGIIEGSNNLTTFTGWDNGFGNLVYDPKLPLFRDAAIGDYRLAAGSQAIDKGCNFFARAAGLNNDSLDLAGYPRYSGSSIDMIPLRMKSRLAIASLRGAVWFIRSAKMERLTRKERNFPLGSVCRITRMIGHGAVTMTSAFFSLKRILLCHDGGKTSNGEAKKM